MNEFSVDYNDCSLEAGGWEKKIQIIVYNKNSVKVSEKVSSFYFLHKVYNILHYIWFTYTVLISIIPPLNLYD